MDASPDQIEEFARAIGPEPTPLQREMEEYGRERGFPILGPAVGGMLSALTRMAGASRVFEFGSGFGYSATWFLRALPDDGEVVLTEVDEDEVEVGREFLRRAGDEDRVTYEVGDALETVGQYDGPFDVALIDHGKERYAEAFDAIAPKLSPGGVVVADNMMRGPFDLDDVLAGLAGEAGEFDPKTRGIVDYVSRVRDAEGFESSLVPLGSGIAISHKVR